MLNIQNDVMNYKLDALFKKCANNEHTTEYAKTVKETADIYKSIFGHHGQSILETLKREVTQYKSLTTTSTNLFLQDFINYLTIDKFTVDFEKYLFLENTANKKSVLKPLALTVPKNTNNNLSLADELEVIFKKGGITAAVMILKILVRCETRHVTY